MNLAKEEDSNEKRRGKRNEEGKEKKRTKNT